MTPFTPFTEERPWGKFRQFAAGEPVTVKTIAVNSGQRLSLQYHEKREEFWAVLAGRPEVTIGDETVRAEPGQEFTIPAKVSHRLSAGAEDALVLEIARGDFDENDIVRIEDDYNRE